MYWNIKKISTFIYVCCFVTFLFQNDVLAQDIPDKPQKETLVVDFANILTHEQKYLLESKLLNYFTESSTQVSVVIVKSLNGYERADYATRLAQKWGIGSAKNDNGILLLVKPKYKRSKGQLYIAVGYGLEGAATDMAVGQIRTNILIPAFIQNDYFGGIDRATDALIALTKGEYNEKQFANKNSGSGNFIIIVIIIFIVIFVVGSKKNNDHHNMNSSGGSLLPWIFFDTLSSRRGGGSFGDFSSGGGSFGDFGGFGGGSFGGGGAGGSW